MKTKFFIFFALLGIFGCVSTKEIEQQTQQQPQAERPIPWKQVYLKNITIKDSVLFYNSEEIKVEGSFLNNNSFAKNGVVNNINTINTISKVVPKLTPGGLVEIIKSASGEINIMFVSFSKKETTYRFSFFRTKDGYFTLNGKAELIFNGKKYPVIASTSDDCILLFYLYEQEIRHETKGQAEGWNYGSSGNNYQKQEEKNNGLQYEYIPPKK